MIKKKEKRTEVLYGYVKPSVKNWVKKQAKKLGYKSKSEFINDVLEDAKKRAK